MKTLTGIDIRRAAQHLGWPERDLRDWLLHHQAIRKTDFGHEAAPPYRGLLSTQTRQHAIQTESGQRINHYYTVILITGDGLAWLRDIHSDRHNSNQTSQPGKSTTKNKATQ